MPNSVAHLIYILYSCCMYVCMYAYMPFDTLHGYILHCCKACFLRQVCCTVPNRVLPTSQELDALVADLTREVTSLRAEHSTMGEELAALREVEAKLRQNVCAKPSMECEGTRVSDGVYA